MSNAPPTPPPVNPIDIDDEARTTASSVLQTADSTTEAPETSVAGESNLSEQEVPTSTATNIDTSFSPSTAVYQRYLPKLLEHSANGQWKEFIEDAMKADLSLDGEQDPNRLQITIPLVLAYMVVDDLPVARSLLRQMHAFFPEAPIIQTLGSLLVAVSGRDYSQIYKRAEALIDYVALPNFPLRELEKMIQNIVPFFVNHFRNQTLVLLTRAYSSLSMKLAISYIGLPPDKVLSFLLKNRWTYDQTTEIFTPPKIKGKGNTPIVPSTLDHFHALAGSVTRLEM
ncbi:hypothetical protein E1B28_009196 [Marasmius oreades]|uniref:CSN8/PSMD8/EIF3K domain-containing protein n=1 Tax=Marasmius oreades TaxID=181124 RepID=A0A9P7S179_9AGAR|nr:uncharacterized protein E1B28_009196 [Marasmius oreades]KAG7092886.1 hypothetical protein E1B28_009196 [Marasmius oreades]